MDLLRIACRNGRHACTRVSLNNTYVQLGSGQSGWGRLWAPWGLPS